MSWYALAISVVSVIASIVSAIGGLASCQQATRANESLESTRAANVYFGIDRPVDGPAQWYILNRNDVPVTDVFFDYVVNGNVSPLVLIGLIESCRRVEIGPLAEDRGASDFRPLNLYSRDIDGNSWVREESGDLTRTNGNGFRDADREVVAAGTSIDGGC